MLKYSCASYCLPKKFCTTLRQENKDEPEKLPNLAPSKTYWYIPKELNVTVIFYLLESHIQLLISSMMYPNQKVSTEVGLGPQSLLYN